MYKENMDSADSEKYSKFKLIIFKSKMQTNADQACGIVARKGDESAESGGSR